MLVGSRSAALRALSCCALVVGAAIDAHGATPLTGVAAVDAGLNHSCVAMQDGGAQCWGPASFVTLGRLTNGFAAGPVQSLPETLSRIAVGESHSCAATTGGRVKCWGVGYYGGLGTGSSQDAPVPVDLASHPTGIAALTAGARHTCSVDLGGTARCWGENYNGQLGIGASGTTIYAPANVAGLGATVTTIDAGTSFTCVVAAGAAKCFGSNTWGQLGDGTNQQRVAPVQVAGLTSGVTRISAGSQHACAVVANAAKCWGANSYGQLGDGTFADRSTPVDVVTLASGVAAVTAGSSHSCALKQDGSVVCWGLNHQGQLGDGTLTGRSVPGAVVGVGGPAIAVSAGDNITCVLRNDGAVRCFGANGFNRLGIASQTIRAIPHAVAGPDWVALDTGPGSVHTCGVSVAGAAWCFGDNVSGQLGTGTQVAQWIPAPVANLASGIVEIRAGTAHSCARTSDGAAWCWGLNSWGQLGDSLGPRLMPGLVPGLPGPVTGIDAGDDHSCAVDNAGGVLCWGANFYGQLGDGTFASRANPAPVSGLQTSVASVVAGADHNCALRTTGGIKCWGANASGQLGDGSGTDRNAPVDVVGLTTGATAVAAGGTHNCAVTASGAVRCWGNNLAGQLGDGSTVPRLIPVNVLDLPSAALAVAAGDGHSCALLADASVHCWGSNVHGQIGPNASQGSSRAVPVPIGAPAASITAGYSHSCARLAGGGAVCWGNGFYGQLGTGDAQFSPLPRDVLIGDFTTTTSIASAPNPSDADDLVTLSVIVSNAHAAPEGYVEFFDGGMRVCTATYLAHGRAACVVNLAQGLHTLTARYVSNSGLLASQRSIPHTVNAIAGQTCAGFDDVDSAHPLCASVDWVRNRNVTLGCTAFDYCGADPVTRLTMAAFMNRVGRVLAPAVDAVSATIPHVSAGFYQCQTLPLPGADYPRRVLVDVMVTGAPSGGEGEVELRAMTHRQFQLTAFGAAARATTKSGRSMTLMASAAFDVPAGVGDFQFGLELSPMIAGGLSYTLDGGCATRVVIVNHNDTHEPYDARP